MLCIYTCLIHSLHCLHTLLLLQVPIYLYLAYPLALHIDQQHPRNNNTNTVATIVLCYVHRYASCHSLTAYDVTRGHLHTIIQRCIRIAYFNST
jgi:hypothetical protein